MYAVKKMKESKFYIVPGFDIKLLRFVSKFIPNSLVSKVVYYQQRKKGK